MERSELRLSQRADWAGDQPISALMHRALAQPDLISLAAGFVDDATLPSEATHRAAASLFQEGASIQASLQYGTTMGHPPLREAIASRMREEDRSITSYPKLSSDQILITAGSNQLLHLVADTILDPGDIVLCAAPSYFVFLGTLANLGVESAGVQADDEGIVPAALEERLAEFDRCGKLPRVKAIYCVSYFDNPRGISLSEERRPQLIEIARKWSRCGRILIIEDTAYRALRYDAPDIPSIYAFDDSADTVITTGTFSKSYSPGIRVGWGVLPKDLVRPVCAQKGNIDFGSPNFVQHLMYHVVASGDFDQHIARLRTAYRQKRDAMLEAAQRELGHLDDVRWIVPHGGLYVWLTLPDWIDTGPDGRLFASALRDGVLYVPGCYSFPADGPTGDHTLRLSFGVQTSESIQVGIQALRRALERVLDEGRPREIAAVMPTTRVADLEGSGADADS